MTKTGKRGIEGRDYGSLAEILGAFGGDISGKKEARCERTPS